MSLHHNPKLSPEQGPDNEPDTWPRAGEPRSHEHEDKGENKLRVSGLVSPISGDDVEIRRGMTILTADGDMAGMVAGVVHSTSQPQAESILLSRPVQQIEYCIVPVALIEQVIDGTVLLHISATLVDTLLPWPRRTQA